MYLIPGDDDPRATVAAVIIVAIALVAAILGAFGCGPQHLPAPQLPDRPVAILTCAAGAEVTIEAAPAFEVPPQTTDVTGVTTFAAVPANVHAFNLHIRAALYAPYDQVGVELPDGNHQFLIGTCWPLTDTALQIRLPAMVSLRPFDAEHGVLKVNDKHFETEDGRPWSWRGSSMFLLYARWVTGQDISSQLDWMKARGINVARVFDLNGNPDWNLPGYGVAEPGPLDPVKLGTFFDLLAANGLRVEYVPLTSRLDLDAMRASVQQAYDVAAGRWNVFIEVCNECENNGIDAVAVMQGVDRHGVLSASGMDPGRHCDAESADYALWAACMRREVFVLPGGYLTAHDLARDAQHSPRNTKDFTQDFASIFRVPIVADEHVGVIDRGYPNYAYEDDGFAHHVPDGGGRRTTDCNVILSAAAIEHIYGPGFTIHLQAGLEGRAPRADEPIQTGCAEQLTKVWQFIPPRAQLGAYSAPHFNPPPFAFQWTDPDSLVGHAYCSPQGGEAWCVLPMPRPGWPGFVGQNGYRVDSVSPIPYIARMVQ